MTFRAAMTPGMRLTGAAALLAATAGCFGGSDTEARGAVEELSAALSQPDAAALRDLVGSSEYKTRTDLLTDDVVAENAFAGHSIDISADLQRFNGYGTFTLTSTDVPDVELSVDLRLTETRTPRGLQNVGVDSRRPLDTVIVNGHRVDVDSPDADADGKPRFYLPPGTWTLDLPPNPFADTDPQTIELLDSSPPDDVTLGSDLNDAGRAEAVAQAEAYTAACGRATKSPDTDCGGGRTICAGEDTTRAVTFSPAPRWTVDADRLTVTHQDGLQRTVTTACSDRDTGVVSERSTRSEPAEMRGTISFTASGLAVDLR